MKAERVCLETSDESAQSPTGTSRCPGPQFPAASEDDLTPRLRIMLADALQRPFPQKEPAHTGCISGEARIGFAGYPICPLEPGSSMRSGPAKAASQQVIKLASLDGARKRLSEA